MKFKTAISKIEPEDIIVRGRKLSGLIGKKSFSQVIFLLLFGREPNEKEVHIFDALLVSIVDHGAGTTSSLTTRCVASTGNTLNAAVGAGVLAQGNLHGGAIENAMRQFKEIEDIAAWVTKKIEQRETIFGFGHKVYKAKDPRVIRMLEVCKEINFNSSYIDLALTIQEEIKHKKGKTIPLNIDGLIAAILLEMNVRPDFGKGIFIIGRVAGLVAQAIEELQEQKKVRRLDEEDITYIGL